MRNRHQIVPQTETTKKPAKAHLTDAEFRLRLKNISEASRGELKLRSDLDDPYTAR